MAAGVEPADSVAAPDGLAHRRWHDGVVPGGKGEDWAGKLGLSFGFIPVHQPAEPLIKPLNVEGFWRREGLGAAGAPEGLDGLVGVAAKAAAHAGNPRRRDMRTEAVEALDADEGAEWCPALLPRPVKQPKHPE